MIDQEIDIRSEETTWARAAQAGDQLAFTNLIERYERAVFNLCYRMLGSHNEAEDAAQEAFLRAYRAIKRYDPERRFSTWVLSIASNYCIDQFRKRRLFTLSLDEMPYLDIAEHGPGPEGRLIHAELEAEIQAVLCELGDLDRATVILRYWYELSYDEIGEALDLTNSAVKSRLHRARRALAEAWETRTEMPAPLGRTVYGPQTV
ncbi:MAG TPA: sigma-70 family RNA polymerase sigma factor [Anaerolineales bacterium]|nr:sigma-70 family RNA polymerase sigma factor [Anaerolineales bacterium]